MEQGEKNRARETNERTGIIAGPDSPGKPTPRLTETYCSYPHHPDRCGEWRPPPPPPYSRHWRPPEARLWCSSPTSGTSPPPLPPSSPTPPASTTAATGTLPVSPEPAVGFYVYADMLGIARYCNYLGDLLLALSFSLPCGASSVIPYFYPTYLLILLVWRERGDEARCSQKYKEIWVEYCKLVPWRILPCVY